MARKRSRDLRPGDILYLKTERGLCYGQVTHYYRPIFGPLVRWFEGFYQEPLAEPMNVLKLPVRFSAFVAYVPNDEYCKELVQVVGHDEALPVNSRPPLVVGVNGPDSLWIWDPEARKETRVVALTQEHFNSPTYAIFPVRTMAMRLCEDNWKPFCLDRERVSEELRKTLGI